jgi:hypothetical protein
MPCQGKNADMEKLQRRPYKWQQKEAAEEEKAGCRFLATIIAAAILSLLAIPLLLRRLLGP